MHGAIDLLERLTIVIRDFVWYFIYKKFKRDERETILKADQFRSPRSMRFVADMSIQMILGESTSMIAAVGFFQIYKFIYNGQKALSAITEFFTPVSIAISKAKSILHAFHFTHLNQPLKYTLLHYSHIPNILKNFTYA